MFMHKRKTIYGRLIGYSFDDDNNKFYRIETDSGNVDAVAMEGTGAILGRQGIFTLLRNIRINTAKSMIVLSDMKICLKQIRM